MRKIVCLLIFLIANQGFGQFQEKIDSLENKLTLEKTDSVKIKVLEDLSWMLKNNQPKKSIFYAKKGILLAKKDFEVKQIGFHNTLGIVYRRLNQIDSAKIHYKRSIALAKKYNKSLNVATSFMNLGVLYKNISETDSAVYFYELGESHVNENDTSQKAIKILSAIKINKANIYENENKIKAIEQLKDVESIYLSLKDTSNIAEVYSNLANIFFDIKDYPIALKYHKKALHYDIKNNNLRGICLDYSLISSTMQNIKGSDSSYYYAQKGLELAKKIEDPAHICFANLILAGSYLERKDFKNAIHISRISLKQAVELKITDFQIFNHVNMAVAYLHTKQLKNTHRHLTLALNLLDKKDIPLTRQIVYDMFMRYYYSINNTNRAIFFSELYDSIRLNNFNNDKLQSIRNIETKYQTQQKENKILQLTNENNKKKAALAQSRLLNFSGAGLMLLLSGIGFFFWQRKKQELKIALLENSIQAGELEKKRIGKELHDGIAGTLIKLVKDVEQKDMQLSNKLLSTYNEVRNLSHQLDNTPMHGEAFMERLIDLIPQDDGNQQFSFKISPVSLEIKEPLGTHLYRIIQELIANNIKHAQASHSTIYISLENNILSLHYEDNGIGIKNLKKGNGFKNIEHRLELIKGKFNISRGLPEGLKIQIDIPYTHEKD